MSKFELDENEDTFLQRNRLWIAIFAMIAVSGGVYAAARSAKNSPPPQKAPEVSLTMVKLPPPPPPPPAPPPPQVEQPKEEEKMIEQDKVDEPEEKPDDSPPPAPEITAPEGDGKGPDFGLARSSGRGTGGSGAGKKASRWGWYAGKIQQTIDTALSSNKKVRTAVFRIEAKIWADSTGRVTRAAVKSTGDADLDKAIRDDVLTGLQLSEAPPADMPMPINLRLTAKRPD